MMMKKRSVGPAPMEARLITPIEAAQLLAGHKNYRKLSPTQVERLSIAISNDEYDGLRDGTPIRITADTNRLVDGQHRLSAIVSLNVAMWFYVQQVDEAWWGDEGRTRSMADYVGDQVTAATNIRTLTSAARIIHTVECGLSPTALSTAATGRDALADVARRWDSFVSEAASICGTSWSGPRSFNMGGAPGYAIVAIGLRHFHQTTVDLIGRCKNDIRTGDSKDNAQALRRFVANAIDRSHTGRIALSIAFHKAIRAESECRQINLIRVAPEGKSLTDEWAGMCEFWSAVRGKKKERPARSES